MLSQLVSHSLSNHIKIRLMPELLRSLSEVYSTFLSKEDCKSNFQMSLSKNYTCSGDNVSLCICVGYF